MPDKRYYLLETAVRCYCALLESDLVVYPRTLFNEGVVIAALKASAKPQYGVMLSEMSAEDRGRALNYVSAFPPVEPTGYVYEFASRESAEKFAAQLREWDARGEVEALTEKLINVASHDSDLQGRVSKALEQLGGRVWENPAARDFEKLDTELPAHMLTAGYPVELVEQLLTRAIDRASGKLGEAIIATTAGPENDYRTRLDAFARPAAEREILGVSETLVRAMRAANVLPPAVLPMVRRALGEEDAGIGATGPDQTAAGAPPDKGGVAKDQPDVSKGSPAKSQDGSKEEPKAPTEHVPSVEQGAPMGDVTLPDGTVVPQDTLRQAFSKMLTVLATQMQQGTDGGTPKGPEQKPEEMPAGEAPPKDAEKKPEGEKTEEPPKDGEKTPVGEKPAAEAAKAESVIGDEEPSPELLRALEEYDEKSELKELSIALASGTIGGLSEVAPTGAGWERFVRRLKKHSDNIANPFALAWWMKKRGYQPETSRASETTRAAAGPGDAPPAPQVISHPAAPARAETAAPAMSRTRIEAVRIALANGKTRHEVAQAVLDGTIFEMTATMPDLKDAVGLLRGKASQAYTGKPATIPDGATPGGKPAEGQDLNTTAARQPAAARDSQYPGSVPAAVAKAAMSGGADKNPPVSAPRKADVPAGGTAGGAGFSTVPWGESRDAKAAAHILENGKKIIIEPLEVGVKALAKDLDTTYEAWKHAGMADGHLFVQSHVLNHLARFADEVATIGRRLKGIVESSALDEVRIGGTTRAATESNADGAKHNASLAGSALRDAIRELGDALTQTSAVPQLLAANTGAKPAKAKIAASEALSAIALGRGHIDHAERFLTTSRGLVEAKKDDEKDEKALALQAWDGATSQIALFKSALFNLVTRDLVQAAHVSEALDAKKALKAVKKIIDEMKEIHEEAKAILSDFDVAHETFHREIGVKEAPAPAPAATPPAVAVQAPAAAPVAAPAPVATPAPAAESVVRESEFAQKTDRAVFRLVRDGAIPARILAGDAYSEIAESVRIACQDLELNAYEVAEVIERISHTEHAATQKVLGITLDESDRKLLAMVVSPRDAAARSLLARTADGREAVVAVDDLKEAVSLLRRFGDARHKLLADDLADKFKAEVASSR